MRICSPQKFKLDSGKVDSTNLKSPSESPSKPSSKLSDQQNYSPRISELQTVCESISSAPICRTPPTSTLASNITPSIIIPLNKMSQGFEFPITVSSNVPIPSKTLVKTATVTSQNYDQQANIENAMKSVRSPI